MPIMLRKDSASITMEGLSSMKWAIGRTANMIWTYWVMPTAVMMLAIEVIRSSTTTWPIVGGLPSSARSAPS